MRKQNCIKDINYYVNSIAKGATQSRYKRKVVLYAMIDDLLFWTDNKNQPRRIK